MSALVEPSIQKSETLLGENRVVLHNISWTTYENLLKDLSNQSAPHLTYDQGTLEIMAPLPPHEKINRDTELIIRIIAAELNIDIVSLGSTTFKRDDLERGFEPDSCFYIKHESIMKNKNKIDLKIDPPPDLIFEVDITSPSIEKLPVYLHLGVPEVWRHNGTELIIYCLVKGKYQISNVSLAFPLLNSEEINYLINQGRALKSTAFLKFLQEWIKNKINS